MGEFFNTTNGEVLVIIKDNVEAPANNVANGEELLNDAQATDNIEKIKRNEENIFPNILLPDGIKQSIGGGKEKKNNQPTRSS
ncbi:hypothetical protein AMTRI_Chr11g98460 [Amborella trichopoda]